MAFRQDFHEKNSDSDRTLPSAVFGHNCPESWLSWQHLLRGCFHRTLVQSISGVGAIHGHCCTSSNMIGSTCHLASCSNFQDSGERGVMVSRGDRMPHQYIKPDIHRTGTLYLPYIWGAHTCTDSTGKINFKKIHVLWMAKNHPQKPTILQTCMCRSDVWNSGNGFMVQKEFVCENKLAVRGPSSKQAWKWPSWSKCENTKTTSLNSCPNNYFAMCDFYVWQ